jgi:hypothetical protein
MVSNFQEDQYLGQAQSAKKTDRSVTAQEVKASKKLLAPVSY